MAQITRSANKTKFETGDIPTQTDFVDLLDSIFHMASDTMDVVPQGSTRRWVTPTQINGWDAKIDTATLNAGLDAKADLSHSHVIADITGLQTTLNQKSDKHIPEFLDEATIQALGTLFLDQITPSFFAELPASGVQLELLGGETGFETGKPLPTTRFQYLFENTSGGDAAVTFQFPHMNTEMGSVILPTSTNWNVSNNATLIMDGTFMTINGEFVFVGIFKEITP